MADKKDIQDASGTFTVDVRGIVLTVDNDWRDDFELIEAIADMDVGNPMAVPRVLYRLAGDKADDVKESLRDGKGIVRITDARDWCLDFIKACNAKN